MWKNWSEAGNWDIASTPCVVRDAPSALLTMRYSVDGIKKSPYPEEVAKAAVSKGARR
jgi:hypothetical protein